MNRSLLGALALVLASTLSTGAAAQRLEAAPSRVHRSPDWTWAVLGIGGGLVLAGLGTGAATLAIQSDLDQVCMLTCPSSHAELQRTGRALAITTDVAWLSGIVLAGFGLAAALALDEEVTLDDEAPAPIAVTGGCGPDGCMLAIGGSF